MKKLISIIATLMCLTFLAAPVLAAPPFVVVGTGIPATDIPNVQNAVDNYKKVLLRGSFNFGYDGIDFTVYPPEIPAVYIEKDVKIFGETDKKGEPLTTISGGFWTFFNAIPIGAFFGAPVADGPRITIENIHFDGAMFAALNFSHTSGLTIANNKITNIIPIGPSEIFGRPNSYWQGGAYISTVFFDPRYNIPTLDPAVVPGAITGSLVFKDNEVDLGNYFGVGPENTMGQAVFAVWTWGAIIEIEGNTIRNVTRNSIELLDNYKAESGTIKINENRVFPNEVGINVPSPSTPNGIVVGWFNDPTGAIDPERYSELSIEDNYVEMQGDENKADPETAIILLQDEAAIEDNHIVLGGAPGGVGIYQASSYGMVNNNQIEGWGYCAIYDASSGFIAEGGNYNTFSDNNIKNFNSYDWDFPWGYDVILEGDYNTLTGGRGAVWDVGVDNVIDENYTVDP